MSVSSSFSDFYAAVARAQELYNGCRVMSKTDAQDFFNELSQIKSLRLDQGNDGCTERSQLIQELLEARGAAHGFFIFELREPNWVKHDAAFAWVQGEQGNEKWVFDPPHFSEPQTEKTWKDYWIEKSKDWPGESLDRREIMEFNNFLIRHSSKTQLQKLAWLEHSLDPDHSTDPEV